MQGFKQLDSVLVLETVVNLVYSENPNCVESTPFRWPRGTVEHCYKWKLLQIINSYIRQIVESVI